MIYRFGTTATLAAAALAVSLAGCGAASPGGREMEAQPVPRASPGTTPSARMLSDVEGGSAAARGARQAVPMRSDVPQPLPVEPRR